MYDRPVVAHSDAELLLARADDGEPVLDHALSSVDSGRAELRGGYPATEYLWDESRGANELVAQRWGVVAPQGERGDAMLDRIERLVARRREQQGGHAVVVHRVSPGQTAAEAARWRKDVFEGPAIHRRDVPRYVLILGDLDEVSLELQVILGADGYVGRLAFDELRDYEAYVDKLLRWESKPAAVDRARAMFHTVRDRTSATTVGHQALMQPGLKVAQEYRDGGHLRASALVEIEHGSRPRPEPMVEEAIKDEPGLLFTISHGAGAPRRGWRSQEQQRREQGGMSFGRSGGLLTGDALREQRFLPGGVWFMLACFGAGTPGSSKYEPWLRALASAGHFSGDVTSVGASLPPDGRPFIAAVPKATLASEQGPIGFIGHVDLAWTYAFVELDAGRPVNRPHRFIDVFSGVLRQDRLGVAFRELLRHYGRTNTELTTLKESGVADEQRRGHLWMLRNDLAGYILLGDPAAQLPIGSAVEDTAQAVSSGIDPYAALGFGGATQRYAAEPPAGRLPEDPQREALERAIGMYMAGRHTTSTILRECRIDLDGEQFEDLAERFIAAGRSAL